MKTRYLILVHGLVWLSMIIYDLQELVAIPHVNPPAYFTLGRLFYVTILSTGYISSDAFDF